ncbi:MAG: Gfo/Idh/MocA family oxidoreductase [Planctomycetaceae bacterium]|nr:Gfo/Idh/MocA family oxidoreductase [Planctomycetaceae bacterium]
MSAQEAKAGRRTASRSPAIQGFEQAPTDVQAAGQWQPVSDRRLRVGIAGYGVCAFGAAFGFQDHPNVSVAAVADLDADQRAALANACRCEKTYASCEELIEDDSIEAVFVATDAPSHARLAIAALKAGKHVASAVPAVFGSLADAVALFEAVKDSGCTYMMFETSCYHQDVHSARQMYRRGNLGRVIYTEGEYWHYFPTPLAAHGAWRTGLPPQWYITHASAYYVGVTGGSFTEVSCLGTRSSIDHLKAENNAFGNPFGTEVALLRTSEGGTARMAVSWDTPGRGGEQGRLRAEKGSFDGSFYAEGAGEPAPLIPRPPLPPGLAAGGHGGSHGYLTNEYVEAILTNRRPLVDVAQALNMTVCGIVAHQSAMKDGQQMKIPQYSLPD